MRFAYIDSQGNEVEIPSEDALRLRIELGAIVADTSFYDGSADRWGPAGDHDLFRRLKRDLNRPARADATSPRPMAGLRPDPASSSLGRPAPRPPATDGAPPPSASDAGGVFDAFADDGGRRGPALPDVEAPFVEPGMLDSASGAALLPDVGGDEPFDFAGFGTLDLQDDMPVAPRSSAPPPENPERTWEAPAPAFAPEPQADPWTVPGREPWPPEPESFAAPAPVPPATRAALGTPEDETPEWLRDDPDFADAPETEPVFPTREELRERHRGLTADEAPPRGPSREARPSHRRAPRTGSPWPRIAAGTALVAVLAAGGFWFLGGGSGAAEAETTAVELPFLAPSLEPVLREAAGAALAATVQGLADLPFRESLGEKPADAWLGGAYMAGAGRFSDVRLYWEAVGRYAQIMQAQEAEIFGDALTAALDGIPLPEADRAAVEARARAGFAAAEPRRAAVYGQLREVVDASLSLHAFLELNEANIDYEPADAGLSRDPVLEAVPITDDLGDEMWNRVAAITSALDALGYLDQVTTQGLLDVFFAKLATVPVE